jgi:hypothetical protein
MNAATTLEFDCRARLAAFRYHVSIPNLIFFPTVKVALAWDSAVTSSGDNPTASTLTIDLDLLVRDSSGVQVAGQRRGTTATRWSSSQRVRVSPTISSSAAGRAPTAWGTAWLGH